MLSPVEAEFSSLSETLRSPINTTHEGQTLGMDVFVLLQVVEEGELLASVLALEPLGLEVLGFDVPGERVLGLKHFFAVVKIANEYLL